MELRKLSDAELEHNLLSLVEKERSLLCVIILHVIELERRKKYLNEHPNLFSYLRDKLKYSHGSAQRRIDAAVLALEVPKLLKDVQSGDLNLTQITTAQVAFRLANKTHKTKISAEVKQKVLEQIKSKSVAESEVILYSALNIKPKSKVKIKRQADESVYLEMVLTKEQWRKFERTKELLSHSVPNGNVVDLIEYFTDRVIAQKDKTIPTLKKTLAKENFETVEQGSGKQQASKLPSGKFVGEENFGSKAQIPIGKVPHESDATLELPVGKSEDLVSAAPTPKHSGKFFALSKRRAIKISIQRAVFARDKCCQFKDPASGKVCGSRWSLQLDHIQPVWAGGTDVEENLRVFCGKHNRYRYKVGAGFATSATRRRSF